MQKKYVKIEKNNAIVGRCALYNTASHADRQTDSIDCDVMERNVCNVDNW